MDSDAPKKACIRWSPDPTCEGEILRGRDMPAHARRHCRELYNKSSAVAEMGDRMATTDMCRKERRFCAALQHILDLHSTFALRSRHVWKYGRHPICDR